MTLWRPVDGWPYEVSSAGDVRRTVSRTRTKAGLVLAPVAKRGGYLHVDLRRPGGARLSSVAALVLETFVGPRPTPEHHAAHADGDRANNSLSNLRWATPTENEADKLAHGRRRLGESHPNAKLDDRAVREIRGLLRNGLTKSEIARSFGVHPSNIRLIERGVAWRHVAEEEER